MKPVEASLGAQEEGGDREECCPPFSMEAFLHEHHGLHGGARPPGVLPSLTVPTTRVVTQRVSGQRVPGNPASRVHVCGWCQGSCGADSPHDLSLPFLRHLRLRGPPKDLDGQSIFEAQTLAWGPLLLSPLPPCSTAEPLGKWPVTGLRPNQAQSSTLKEL